MLCLKELLKLLPVLLVHTKCVCMCVGIYAHTHLVYVAALSQISKKLYVFFPLTSIAGIHIPNSLMFEVLFFTEDQNCCSLYRVRTLLSLLDFI